MTILIKQRTPTDCGVCSLAMATGRTYEDVLGAVGDCYDAARGMRYMGSALERLGFSYAFQNGEPVGDIVVMQREWSLSPKLYRRMIWGRRALVSVPSLNNEGGWHLIYFDGEAVFDPSPLKTYTAFEQLEPEEIVLFRQRAARSGDLA
jgi:hypothetical protein